MVKATQTGDYEKIIDLSHGNVVAALGGKNKALETVQRQMQLMKDRKMMLTEFKIGEPWPFTRSKENKFVVVPTQITLTIPGNIVQADSFLLGISADQGKTWKFVDGAGIKSEKQQEKILPPLPKELKLPELKPPRILPEE